MSAPPSAHDTDTHTDTTYQHAVVAPGMPGEWSSTQEMIGPIIDMEGGNPSEQCCYVPGQTWNVTVPSGVAGASLHIRVCTNGTYSLTYTAWYNSVQHIERTGEAYYQHPCFYESFIVNTSSSCDFVVSGATLTLTASGTFGPTELGPDGWDFDLLKSIIMESTDGSPGYCSRNTGLVTSLTICSPLAFRAPFGGEGGYIHFGCRTCGSSPFTYVEGYVDGGFDATGHCVALGHATGQIT